MEDLKEKIQSAVNIYKSGNLIKAEEISRDLIRKNPKVIFLYNLLGIILTSKNKIDEAIRWYEKGISINPDYAMIYNNLGQIFFNNESDIKSKKTLVNKIENYYKKAILLDKKIPEPLTNLGNLYNSINKIEEAEKYHKLAIEVNSNFFYAHFNLANVYISKGDFENAKTYLQEAIKINKNFSDAHRLLSRVTKYKKETKHIDSMINLYKKNGELHSRDKVNLGFALGKAHEDIMKFKEAFLYYKEANLNTKFKINFNKNEEINRFTKIKNKYDKNLFKKFKNIENNNSNRIFIVGMPRSGTTLIEQILSSHNKVFGADEVELVPSLINKYLNDDPLIKEQIIRKMSKEYNDKMNFYSKNAMVTTDKLPENFISIGLIKLIFPKAKIIHCKRNPEDNIFSIYKNYFPGGKINYASNLDSIVEYYNMYLNIMKHWEDVLPNQIYNIKYENLIKNTKLEIKKLLNYCELSWDVKCLEFYKNQRVVKTASDTQVRKKIYNSSIDNWKNFEEFLRKPFLNIKTSL